MFVARHRDRLSLEVLGLLEGWCQCETLLRTLLQDERVECASSEVFEARRDKLTMISKRIVLALGDVDAASVWDVAAKLLVWRSAAAPDVEDFSQFTPTERLALTACEALALVLDDRVEDVRQSVRAV